MSICVPAATDEGLAAATFAHFGSAPFFVFHDPESQMTEVVENGNAHHGHGACQPLVALGDRRVEAIIVGGIGARAIQRLNEGGVRVYRAAEGSIETNIEKLLQNELPEITAEGGCSGHHGADHDCG